MQPPIFVVSLMQTESQSHTALACCDDFLFHFNHPLFDVWQNLVRVAISLVQSVGGFVRDLIWIAWAWQISVSKKWV